MKETIKRYDVDGNGVIDYFEFIKVGPAGSAGHVGWGIGVRQLHDDSLSSCALWCEAAARAATREIARVATKMAWHGWLDACKVPALPPPLAAAQMLHESDPHLKRASESVKGVRVE